MKASVQPSVTATRMAQMDSSLERWKVGTFERLHQRLAQRVVAPLDAADYVLLRQVSTRMAMSDIIVSPLPRIVRI
jgi:hypothetical protein